MQIRDTKAKRPVVNSSASGSIEGAPTALVGWGHLVLIGTDTGILYRWDTITGHTTSIFTNQASYDLFASQNLPGFSVSHNGA